MKDTEENRRDLWAQGLNDGEIALQIFGDKGKTKTVQKWRKRRGLKANVTKRRKPSGRIMQEVPGAWCVILRDHGASGFYRRIRIRDLPPVSGKRPIFWDM